MAIQENSDYLTKQIITYLGNKRKLLPMIVKGCEYVLEKENKDKLSIFDGFSGSGIVSRCFKRFASELYTNDMEYYTKIINQCYLTNSNNELIDSLQYYFNVLNAETQNNLHAGFITQLYSPADEENIQEGERVFYTSYNAQYIDTVRQAINNIPTELQCYFIAPLLAEASIHANTAGVFKGFYKKDGIGHYGGTKENALERILGKIKLELPVFSNFNCDVHIYQNDIIETINSLPNVDLAYLDPPYNQHPYSSNYFMLNLISTYECPEKISKVAGVPSNWTRSLYNKPQFAQTELFNCIAKCPAKYIMLSYNSEGFIPIDDLVSFLNTLGQVRIYETQYNTFRGCRNLKNRNIHTTEYLFLLEK